MYITFLLEGDDTGASPFALELDGFPPVGTTLRYSSSAVFDETKWSADSIEDWRRLDGQEFIVLSNHIDVRNYDGM